MTLETVSWAGHAELVSVADALKATLKSDPDSTAYLNSSVQSLLRLTSNLIEDVNQVARLRTQNALYLSPSNKTWIDHKLNAANDTLRSVAFLLIPLYDAHQKNGNFHLRTRLKLMIDREKVEANCKALTSMQVSINSTMPFLENAESRRRFVEPDEASWDGASSQGDVGSRNASSGSSVGYRRPKLRQSSRISQDLSTQSQPGLARAPRRPPSLHLRNSSFDPAFTAELFQSKTEIAFSTDTLSFLKDAAIAATAESEQADQDINCERQASTASREASLSLDLYTITTPVSKPSLLPNGSRSHSLPRNSSEIRVQNHLDRAPVLDDDFERMTTAGDSQSLALYTERGESDWNPIESPSDVQKRELSLHLDSPSALAPEVIKSLIKYPPRSSSWETGDDAPARGLLSEEEDRSHNYRTDPPSPVPPKSPTRPSMPQLEQSVVTNAPVDRKAEIGRGVREHGTVVLMEQPSTSSTKNPVAKPSPSVNQISEPVELDANTRFQRDQEGLIPVSLPLPIRPMPISTSENRLEADTSKILTADADVEQETCFAWDQATHAQKPYAGITKIPVKRPKQRVSAGEPSPCIRALSYSCGDYSMKA